MYTYVYTSACLFRDYFGQLTIFILPLLFFSMNIFLLTVLLCCHLFISAYLEPPLVIVDPPSQTVTEGTTVVFRCIITAGTLPVTTVWTKLGGALPASAIDNNGILEISNAAVEDAGNYKCQATNEAGVSEAFADLTVRDEAYGKGMLIHMSRLYLIMEIIPIVLV